MKSTPPHSLFRSGRSLKTLLCKGVAALSLMAFIAQPVIAATPKTETAAKAESSSTTTKKSDTQKAKPKLKEEISLKSKTATKSKTAEKTKASETTRLAAKTKAESDSEPKSAKSKAKTKTELANLESDDKADTKTSKSSKSKSAKAEDEKPSAKSKSSKSKKTELASASECAAVSTKASAKSKKSKSAAKVTKVSAKAMAQKVSSKKGKSSKLKGKCALLAKAEKPEAPPAIISFAPAQLASLPRPYEATKPRVPARSFDPNALSAADIALYRQAFDQNAQGQFDAARETTAQIGDKSLMGYVDYSRLMSTGYESTYEELTAWMTQYGDLPAAMKVWGLAKRKKPAFAPDPAFPVMARGQSQAEVAALDIEALSESGPAVRLSSMGSFNNPANNAAPLPVESLPIMGVDLTPKSARSAYNDGKLEDAIRLGVQIGDRWVAGLATYRLKRFSEAEAHFEFIAKDPSQNAWSRSGGAYWAGRCALLSGKTEEAQLYFKLAASFPFTFYGLVAEQKLGIESAVTRAKKGLPPLFAPEERSILSASLDGNFGWAQSKPEAKRVAALILVDRRAEARAELQNMVQRASDQTTREQWLALAAWSNLSVSGLNRSDKLFDFSSYEVPDYQPTGGFTLDRALVYALSRKESKFNPKAVSYSGAYGLMQLMPATAALVADDPTLRTKPSKLLKPSTNMRVGQDYIHRLLDTQIINGDLLRAVAAYNGGPRPVQDALRSLGPNPDSLLVMESIPVAQSRAYVEEVVASYWIYQKLMDKPSATLAQAASDALIVRAADDVRAKAAPKTTEKASETALEKADEDAAVTTPQTLAAN